MGALLVFLDFDAELDAEFAEVLVGDGAGGFAHEVCALARLWEGDDVAD
jgi:hypothetical protein